LPHRISDAFVGRVRERAACVPLLRHAPRALVATAVCLQLLIGAAPLLFMLFSSAAVGQVRQAAAAGTGSAAWSILQRDLIVSAAVLVVAQVLAPAQQLMSRAIQLRVDAQLYQRLMAANFASPGVTAMERPDVRVELEEAVDGLRSDRRSGGASAAASITLLARYTGFAGSLLLVGLSFSWIAAALAAVAGMALRRAHRTGFVAYHEQVTKTAHLRRRHWHLQAFTLSPDIGKESRVFGLAHWLADRGTDEALDFNRPLWRARMEIFIRPFVWAAVVSALGGALALAGLAWPAVGGGLPVGRTTLVAQAVIAILGIGAFFDESDVETAYGTENLRHIERVEAAISEAATSEARPGRTGDTGADPVGLPQRSIRFEDVSFSYPGAPSPVLSGFTLDLAAGSSLAVVGVNGAGKTTLIKLLCRFYEPGSGRITVDGTDLRVYDAARWQRRIAATFQDFGRYPLSAADNIGFGAAELVHDRAQIRGAAERAGADAYLDALDDGLDTTLSREFQGGTDLSGGQWQRLALARALLAVEAGASMLVLDEPTASLDVRAEADFIENFLDLTKGTTTIVVSHRFSTVRRADRIVVLDGGRLVEDGSHEELMAAGGRYAEMFELQAARFTAAVGRNDGRHVDRRRYRHP
jgi:ATP-binding cassette, subfamily B, bacterial